MALRRQSKVRSIKERTLFASGGSKSHGRPQGRLLDYRCNANAGVMPVGDEACHSPARESGQRGFNTHHGLRTPCFGCRTQKAIGHEPSRSGWIDTCQSKRGIILQPLVPIVPVPAIRRFVLRDASSVHGESVRKTDRRCSLAR